jgi:RecA DNA recombination protein
MVLGMIARAGEITEIVGRLSSGRTSLLMAILRHATARGAVAALVDVDDAFDVLSAARAGVELDRLLWVRCGRRRDVALRATDLLVRCPGFAIVGLDLGEVAPRLSLAAAFRLRLATRRSRVALVVLSARRIAGAGAALALETVQGGVDWSGPARTATRLACLRSRVSVLRDRGALPAPATDLTWWSEASA